MSVSKTEKADLILKYGKNAKNTGDDKAQIAILTADIEKLKLHFAVNKKDNHSKRGFLAKIEKRKKILKNLRQNNFDEYKLLIADLNIRK